MFYSKKDLCQALTDACNIINEKQKNAQKTVCDVFGRVYVYENEEDLKNIQLDENAWKATQKIADLLI